MSCWSDGQRIATLGSVVRTTLTLILTIGLALLGQGPAQAGEADEAPSAEQVEVTQLVAAGWAFLSAGSLVKAEDAFTRAWEKRPGKDRAEVYYALSAVWWERRNAMASYSWLHEAQEAKKNSWYWDAGDDGSWDRRITGRIRYIERNFTVIKLRFPASGKPLPPLADPPPADPMLRSFTDAIARQVTEGSEAGAGVQWFFLPNGRYWAAGQDQDHRGGEMEPTRADSWDVVGDRGAARRKYDERAAAIAAREAEADAQAAALLEARQRAWQKQHRPASEAGEPGEPVATTTDPTPDDTRRAPEPEPVVARPMVLDPDQRPIAHRLITYDTAREVSRDLSARWRAGGFHARYGVTCPNPQAEHEIDFPDQDFYVRFAEGSELKVRGSERLTEKLRSDWLVGGVGEMNLVELWYDGRKLLVVVNGVEFGPVTVRRGRDDEPVGRWDITLTDPRSEIQHLWIEPWQQGE